MVVWMAIEIELASLLFWRWTVKSKIEDGDDSQAI